MWSGLDELGASQNILAHQFERPISKMVGIVIETVNFRVGNRLFKCFITRFRFCSVKAKVSKTRPKYFDTKIGLQNYFGLSFLSTTRLKKLFPYFLMKKIKSYPPIFITILLSFRVILDLRRLDHAI